MSKDIIVANLIVNNQNDKLRIIFIPDKDVFHLRNIQPEGCRYFSFAGKK